MSKGKDRLPPYVRNAERVRKNARPRLGYSIQEFADAIGVSRSLIYQALRQGQLTARKIGKRTVISAEDANKFLNRLPVWSPILPKPDNIWG